MMTMGKRNFIGKPSKAGEKKRVAGAKCMQERRPASCVAADFTENVPSKRNRSKEGNGRFDYLVVTHGRGSGRRAGHGHFLPADAGDWPSSRGSGRARG